MTQFNRTCAVLCLLISASTSRSAEPYVLHSFQKLQLTDQFYCEGATFADVNRDDAMDVVSGPYWYAGPSFTKRSEIYPPAAFDIATYSENFLAFAHDVDRDGWTDVIVIGFPGKETWWYHNPQGKEGHWQRHLAMEVTDNESPGMADVTGDGRPELVCSDGGKLGYAQIPADDPTKPWPFRAISPNKGYERFTHGLGVGEVSGDGRADFLERNGWYEQPADPQASEWEFHPVPFSEAGGAQMLVADLDGDGDNDVVTSKAAHAYGLAWFENAPGAEGKIEFKEHPIMGERPEENEYGVAFSQLHSLALADMNGDGIQDIVTGKRFWAHADKDPGALEPAVLYWFQTARDGGEVEFIPHQIDDNSGVGTQVMTGDLNDDDLPDVIVGNKKGTFVFLHHADEVDRKKWEAAQPVPTSAQEDRPDIKSGAGANPPSADGFPATAADGRVLNLDLEQGDLTDWTATGAAFERQPIADDTVHRRRPDSKSGHQGKYWIGSYERSADLPQGTLTSAAFLVTHPYASFFVAGGAGGACRVEIVRADTDEVVFAAAGLNAEEMRPVVVDLRKLQGVEVRVRIVDGASAGWGHINFDHFRIWDEEPAFKQSLSSNDAGHPEEYPYAGLPAEQAARVMHLPEGFNVIVSAAEPDVKQPIAMTLDDRGRVWVAEAYAYPVRAPEGQGRDRILVFEDQDGDGKFDSRKVFSEGLNLVSGMEVGFGGVWVGASPYLMFIPDRNGDDVPDGEPEILLDGWAWQDTHETLNSFIWGPDGWLYGCHGVFTHSRVGKPGTPDEERIPLNAAIWRYHPTRHVFEIFAEGTSNPWGVDFDDHGQAFSTACVIPHLYHVIQGGRYQRQAGQHFNPYTYADIQTIADHRHHVGDSWRIGAASSTDAGGGHAHAGAMIYLGGSWPDEYRGRIFMNNIHGQRLNTDILKRDGSGFVGSHGPDFLLTGDLASQMLYLRYGPDGNVFVIDWYDTNACHHNNVEGHDRTNGRIYKVCYGEAKREAVDLKKASDEVLVGHLAEKNDWYVRHARRILQERAAAGTLEPEVREKLRQMAIGHPQPARQLRAMWALHAVGGLSDEVVSTLLASRDEYVRAWTVQLALDRQELNLAALLPLLSTLANSDRSPVVQLYLASALQRLPLASRWQVLQGLVQHGHDAGDHNLPLMIWYAAEPLAEADPARALALGQSAGKNVPLVRDFMLRRISGLDSPAALAMLVEALKNSSDADQQVAHLKGIRRGLQAERRVEPPLEWNAVYKALMASADPRVQSEAMALGVTFGDAAALDAMRKTLANRDVDATVRREALSTLLQAKDPQLPPLLVELLEDTGLREASLAGLSQDDDPKTPARVLAIYSELSAAEKRAALGTLTSRPSYGLELLRAIASGQVAKSDLSADLARQLHHLEDGKVDQLLADVWGTVRSTEAEKEELIENYRELLAESSPADADAEFGRAVFARTCQQCHVLFGSGKKVGPDLTGSNRGDLEFLLSNIVDPNALVAKDYFSTVIVTRDGRVVTGLVTAEDDQTLTIHNATETLLLPKEEIDERQLGTTSMMPDDQLKQFSPREILSLFSYLGAKSQVPMLATKDTASMLFNGRNLTGWQGDSELWSVEDGEIVGRSPGLKHNSFLVSDMTAENFRLSLEVKLVNNGENSGVQFRSRPLRGHEEVKGYQADIGAGVWGTLYEENGRALLSSKSGEAHIKPGDWNRYEIEAVDSRVRTWLNGEPCVDLDDPEGSPRGVFALQIHLGGPLEVRFRNLKLEVK